VVDGKLQPCPFCPGNEESTPPAISDDLNPSVTPDLSSAASGESWSLLGRGGGADPGECGAIPVTIAG